MKKTIAYLFLTLSLLTFGVWPGVPSARVSARTAQGGAHGKVLIGNIQNLKVTVSTDVGPQTSTFNGQLGFEHSADQSGRLTLGLKSLNLIGMNQGVGTKGSDLHIA